MIKPRVVFDTNIYLSAIVFGGIPRKLLQLAFDEKIIVYTSAGILLEISQKLKNKFLWPQNNIIQTIKAISKIAVVVKPKTKLTIIKKDPTDNKILEAAVKAKANYIISGDQHLLELGKFKNIIIVSPAAFLMSLRTQ